MPSRPHYQSLIPLSAVALCTCIVVAIVGRTIAAPKSMKSAIDTARIETLLGAKGTFIDIEGVYKLTFPRTDVPVTVGGMPLDPFMGLTSWVSFTRATDPKLMAMGDLVLFQDEVNPVMSSLLDSGVQVTALHNHFFNDEPRVLFMHIAGEEKVETLASAVRKALDTIHEVRRRQPTPAPTASSDPIAKQGRISSDAVAGILGVKGQSKDGMFKAVVGRSADLPCGCAVGKEMGVNTWAAFAGSDERAIVDGDFAVHEDELQPVLKSLRRGGIDILAIHNHMTGENPRFVFLHYWGTGPAAELARTLRATLDTLHDGPPPSNP